MTECLALNTGYKDWKIVKKPAKKHGHSHSREQMIEMLSDKLYPFYKYTKEDIIYAKQELNDKLLNLFGYNFNVDDVLRDLGDV